MVFKNRKTRKILIIISSIVLSLALILGACALYLGDYYQADKKAIAAFSPLSTREVEVIEEDNLVFKPKDAKTGFIFYPGGKVEYTAYVPLMKELASRGILCVLVEMPFHLAVFDVNAADGIQAQYPEIENWYIGGHSLGGAMAASYLEVHADEYDGLVLLGAYSTVDLSKTELKTLCVYGSEDKVMNREKYEANKSNLPTGFSEFVIQGGCHAYFGMYGEQEGDGTPTISNVSQIYTTVGKIFNFMETL